MMIRMSAEMGVLCLSVILGFVHLIIQAQTATAARGPKWNLSSRDEQMPRLTGIAGRAGRAFENFKETFPFFLAAVFLVMSLGRAGTLSALGAYMYLAGRVLYLPCYLFNVVYVRTLIYSVSAIGILLVLVQAFIGSSRV